MIGTYCAYEDLSNIIRTNRYLHASLQSSLNVYEDMLNRYKSINIYGGSLQAPYDAELRYYNDPLFVLGEIMDDPLLVDYVKHLKLGRMDDAQLQTYAVAPGYYDQLDALCEEVFSKEDFWTQLTQSSVVAGDLRGCLYSSPDFRREADLYDEPVSRHSEYVFFYYMLLVLLPKLRHLEVC